MNINNYETFKEITLEEVIDKNTSYSFVGGPFGSDLKSEEYTDNGVRIIQLQNIKDGYFSNNYKIFTSEKKADELLKCNIFPGDIIIAKMAEPLARACIIPNFEERYVMASDGIRLVVDEDHFNKKYIFYFINSSFFREQAIENSTGTTRQRIGLKTLRKLKVLAPPIKEQQKIAAILTSVDDAIEKTEAIIKQTEKVKKGLMQQLLTKGIRHTKFKQTEIGEIPEDWEVISLREISEHITKGTTPSTYGFGYENEGINFIKVENIDHQGKFIKENMMKISSQAHNKLSRSEIKKNDILLTIAGALGRVAIVNEEILPANTNQAIAIVRKKENTHLNRFIYFALNGYVIKQSIAMVSTIGAQPNLSLKQVGDFKIAFPLKYEQEKIVKILSEVEFKSFIEQDKLKSLQILKKSLMQVLLTGKVRVKVNEWEATK